MDRADPSGNGLPADYRRPVRNPKKEGKERGCGRFPGPPVTETGRNYGEILKKGQPDLRRKENLVKFRDRYVYVKRIECKIGKDKNLAYAYIGFDVDGSGDTNHKVMPLIFCYIRNLSNLQRKAHSHNSDYIRIAY